MSPCHLLTLSSPRTRRDFLQAAAGATAALAPYWFTASRTAGGESLAKQDRLRIGAIGVGGRGMADTRDAAKLGQVVAVCDLDREHAEKAQAALGGKPDIYHDYRELLQRKDIDVIVNGTPDHWHTAVNIAACKAGKDVYAEKPMTLTIAEGKLLCKVVEETGRIVQVGTQQRSESPFKRAVELVRNGRIGKLRQVWVALPWFSTKGGPFPAQPVPKALDWDFYQGQAPLHAYCRQRAHGTYRWWYEYAGGIVTDWGNHHMDIAQWGMDCDRSGPAAVEARALFPNPQGPEYYNTPDRFFARLTYPSGVEVLFFSAIGEKMKYGEVQEHQSTSPEEIETLFGKDAPEEVKKCNRNGIMFIGDGGRLFVNRGGVHGKAVDELPHNPLPADAWRAYPSTDHMANFFECVRTRKQPCATVEIEHRTSSACHLVNIALRLKRKLVWDPLKQEIVGDAEANAWQQRGEG